MNEITSGGRSGPLSNGQQWHWLERHLPRERHSFSLPLLDSCLLPEGVSTPDLRTALRTLVRRHEALRTTFSLDEPTQYAGDPDQHPITLTEVPVDGLDDATVHRIVQLVRCTVPAVDATAEGAPAFTGTPAEKALHQAISDLSATEFDVTREWPWRAAALVRDGAPTVLVLAMCHIAADGWALAVLLEELVDLLQGKDLPPARHHPLDQAAAESTPRAQSDARVAHAHWMDLVRAHPHNLLMPFCANPGEGETRHALRLRSATLLADCQTLSDRHGVSQPMVVLAAWAFLIAERTGAPRFYLDVIISNRPTARTRTSIGPYSAPVLVPVHAPPGLPFTTLLHQLTAESRHGYRHSRYDPGALQLDVFRHAADTGEYPFSILDFNYLSYFPDTQATDTTEELTAQTVAGTCGSLYLDLEPDQGALRVDLNTGDHLLTQDEARELLRRMAEVLHAAAAGEEPVIPAERTGVAQEGWAQLGAGWVNLELTAEVLGACPGVDAVELSIVDGKLRAEVVGVGQSPAALRRFVVDRVAELPGLVAPQWFVVRAEPGEAVLAEGDGKDLLPVAPEGAAEHALAAAVVAVLPEVRPDMGRCLAELGGTLLAAPLVLAELGRRGYSGLLADELLSTESLGSLAARLEPLG